MWQNQDHICKYIYNNMTSLQISSIDGVKNNVLASSVIDNEFESRLGQDYKIGICCISTKHVALSIQSID
jgi:hypothetical protein